MLAGASTASGSLSPPGLRVDPAVASSDSDYVDQNFIAGTISEVAPSGEFLVRDLDAMPRAMRVSGSSRAWKRGRWNVDQLRVGDCVFARGESGPAGVLDVDRLWANIISYRASVAAVGPSEIRLTTSDGGERSTRIDPISQVQDPTGSYRSGDSSALRPGDSVHVIEFMEPELGTRTASRILNFSGIAASAADDDEDIPKQEGGCKVWKGLTTWFCCGNVGGCGRCGGFSGEGACSGCRSDRHHMAWPKLNTGCGPFCGNCCLSGALEKTQCGRDILVYNNCNPVGNTVNVQVKDCGPEIHCVGSTGCLDLKKVKFDLTPCAFTVIGDLDAGVKSINAQKC